MKNLALHPPHVSKTHLELGKFGHVAVSHGLAKQFTNGTPGGHTGGEGVGSVMSTCIDKNIID